MISSLEYLWIAIAALAAGAVNALAGGGTLITFPTLIFFGIPPISASVTNTVALCPGYFGATLAQSNDLRGQRRRLLFFLPVSVVGGIIGGILLLNTGERLFRELVPYLILLASGLLAVQEPLRAWLIRKSIDHPKKHPSEALAVLPVGLAAIYGGYFGAGLSVIVLAVLAVLIEDTLTRLNGLKQAIAFAANIAAAIFFLFSEQVVWPVALVMAIGALIGGTLGGRLAGKIQPSVLRKVVVTFGVIVGLVYLFRG